MKSYSATALPPCSTRRLGASPPGRRLIGTPPLLPYAGADPRIKARTLVPDGGGDASGFAYGQRRRCPQASPRRLITSLAEVCLGIRYRIRARPEPALPRARHDRDPALSDDRLQSERWAPLGVMYLTSNQLIPFWRRLSAEDQHQLQTGLRFCFQELLHYNDGGSAEGEDDGKKG